MNDAQKIQLRQGEVRTRLTELGAAEMTDDARSEHDRLVTEYSDLDRRYAGAVITQERAQADAEADFSDDGEAAEVKTLVSAATVGEIIDARLQHRVVGGPELELQAAFGLKSNVIPAALFAPAAAAVQLRATTVTGDGQGNQNEAQQHVYASPTSAYAGIQRRTVQPGISQWPEVIGAATDVPDDVSAGADGSTIAQALTVHNLTPHRISITVDWQREQALTIPGLQEMLANNVRNALTSALDKFSLIEASEGVYAFGSAPAAVSAVVTFADIRTDSLAAVDGSARANTIADIRLLCGLETYRLLPTLDGGPTNNEYSALDWLQTRAGGVAATAYAPIASNDQQAVWIRGGGINGVQAVWDDLTVEDPFTDAKKAITKLTFGTFTDVQVFSGGLVRKVYQTA